MTKAFVCRLLGIRTHHWPNDWPLPSGHQVILIRALHRAGADAFVAAVDSATGVYRIVVLTSRPGRVTSAAQRGREYALLRDGRLRYVRAGEPYEDETVAA